MLEFRSKLYPSFYIEPVNLMDETSLFDPNYTLANGKGHSGHRQIQGMMALILMASPATAKMCTTEMRLCWRIATGRQSWRKDDDNHLGTDGMDSA